MAGARIGLLERYRAGQSWLRRFEPHGVDAGSTLLIAALVLFLLFGVPSFLHAQTDCLSCHADKTLQDASGHSVGVDANKFHASIHGSLGCTDCQSSIRSEETTPEFKPPCNLVGRL